MDRLRKEDVASVLVEKQWPPCGGCPGVAVCVLLSGCPSASKITFSITLLKHA